MYLNDIKEKLKKSLKSSKLNHIIAPMGSGKTTLFKNLIRDYGVKTLVLSPYRVSQIEYKDIADLQYPSTLCSFIARDAKTVEEFYFKLKEYLSRYELILFDETDFLYVQAEMNNNANLLNSEDNYLSMLQAMILLFYAATANKGLAISTSAGTLEFPPKVRNKVFEWQSIGIIIGGDLINVIKPDIRRKINLKVVKFYYNDTKTSTSTFKRRMMWHIYNLHKDRDAKLIYFKTGRWTKVELNELRKLGAAIIVREENIDVSYSSNDKTYYIEALDKYENLFVTGKDDDDFLSDEMFDKYDVIAINTNNSRAISLTKKYKLGVVAIFDDYVNRSNLQAIGRFRKSPVKAIFVGTSMKHMVPEEVGLKENLYLAYNDGNYRLFHNIENIWCLYENKTNISIKIKGMSKGKYKGKAINETTRKRREHIHYWLSNKYDNSLTIRDNYKLYKQECSANNIKHFSEKKFRQYLSLALNWFN